MRLTPGQIERFDTDGFLVLPDLFGADEITTLRTALPSVYAEDTPANIREKRGGEVRTAMGLHLRHPAFGRVVRHPRLIEPAFQLLGERLYIQQVKINTKTAFEGEV
jgi:ectoine hydroxylase